MNINSDVLPHVRLRFHLESPALEACWNEGYDAASEEFSEEANPYAESSRENDFWQQGWWAGFYCEERLFAPSLDSDIIDNEYNEECKMTGYIAMNDEDFRSEQTSRWWRRLGKVAGVMAVAVAAIELLEIAV